MTDSHDPMCPQHGQTMRSIIAFDIPCRCEFIDRVRADERGRALEGLSVAVEALHGRAPSTYWDDALDEVADMIADEVKR